MLEMAILETQIFWGVCPQTPRNLAPSALVGAIPPPPLLKILDPPLKPHAECSLDGRFVKFCGVHSLGRKQKARNGQLSRSRPIIARFTCERIATLFGEFGERSTKNARISINEEFPKEIREIRKQQWRKPSKKNPMSKPQSSGTD